MNRDWGSHINLKGSTRRLVWGFGLVVVLSLLGSAATYSSYLIVVPPFLMLAYVSVVDFKKIYWMLLAFLPLSTEFYLPNGFGTDLPTEPLMLGLTGITLLYTCRHGASKGTAIISHPITLLLFAHLGWIFISTILSELTFVSVKFLMAKLWYIIPFYFLTFLMVRDNRDTKTLLWVFVTPLMCTVLATMIRHGLQGFTFESIHFVLKPYQRNHVNYAAMLAYTIPMV
ncbi:MAG: hypothetical protein HRU40_10500 [Saprospiraceae bacterium]|nr:hypothetical protein [Saprospiraceae bacterium]